MVAFSSLQTRNTDLIRKSLDGLVLVAASSASLPTSLTTGASGDLVPLPSGYLDVGWLDKGDGTVQGRKVDSAEVTSWGSALPTRRDITKADNTIAFTLQETNRKALELYHGITLATGGFDPTTKEVAFTEASRPATIFYRVLVLWTDLTGTDAIFGGSLYPRASVTDLQDIKLTDAGDPVARKVTMTAYVDSSAGFAVKHLYGGPGWISRLTAMGWS